VICRRDIYSKCADLLFVIWDGRRHITQPEALPAQGPRLMQEIARAASGSEHASGGLPERIAQRTIARQMARAGATEEGAERDSRDFLEFCAGRAWLLGAFGTTDDGQRLFAFTHRTFLEFFTAEAVARSSRTNKDISDQVLKAYDTNSTSVLPELLVQAADERSDRAAEEIFRLLLGLPGRHALKLRLVNATPLPSEVKRAGFETLTLAWEQSRSSIDLETAQALVSLDSGSLAVLRALLELDDNTTTRLMYAYCWASLTFTVGSVSASRAALDLASITADLIIRFNEAEANVTVQNWLAHEGAISAQGSDWKLGLIVPAGAGQPALGALWWLTGGAPNRDGRSSIPFVRQWLRFLDEGGCVSPKEADTFARLVVDSSSNAAMFTPRPGEIDKSAMEKFSVRISLLMLCAEVRGTRARIFSSVSSPVSPGGSLSDVLALREQSANMRGSQQFGSSLDRAHNFLRILPRWADEWATGRRNFVDKHTG
jgi:hypothetical protein